MTTKPIRLRQPAHQAPSFSVWSEDEHLTDEALTILLDDDLEQASELDASASGQTAEEHAAACESCSARLIAIADEVVAVHGALYAAGPELLELAEPRQPRQLPRAAIGWALAIAAAAAIPGWFADPPDIGQFVSAAHNGGPVLARAAAHALPAAAASDLISLAMAIAAIALAVTASLFVKHLAPSTSPSSERTTSS